MKKACLHFACFIFSIIFNTATAQQLTHLANLHEGDTLHGFKTTALYLNEAEQPMGGRFIHLQTGFTLDLLQIESVPQAFIWVNTFPVSDKGEPHTQEHLLITKGNKGRELNTRSSMSLVEENAFTSQLHTVYDFNTGAGADVFYTMFERYLDALLDPDYTDEEVRREVRNWGITQNTDSTLRIEEKGSVYNEMSTSMNNAYSLVYDTLGRMLYGNKHPLSYNAGGLPSGIRTLTSQEIAAFHQANYFPGNMGAITSVPQSMTTDSVLITMNNILKRLSKTPAAPFRISTELPAPQPLTTGQVALINYPSENQQETGTLMLAYPASLQLTATEDILLSNFLSVFAGDATTNLYKTFVDSKTKVSGMDAQAVYAYRDNKQGEPVYIGLDGIKSENLTKEKAMLARQIVIDELKKIAAYRDRSPQLEEFNKRYANSLLSFTRSFAKFVNSPPRFGFRNTYDSWYDQLLELNKISGFKKSVVLKSQFEEVTKMLQSGTNIWKTYLKKWNLTTAIPYAVITKPNADLIKQADSARRLRAVAEVARLQSAYRQANDQQTIQHYKALYDSTTAALEKLQQQQSFKFIDNPPLTLDDQLIYKADTILHKIPVVSSIFNNMSSSTAGIALNLTGVPQNKLLYLAMLPDLLTKTGIIKNGRPVSYDSMSQLLQKEILSLESYYTDNPKTGRSELIIKAAGNNAAESQKAIEWIRDVLQSPNWTEANLPRMRDLVEQDLSALRQKMHDAEESWVTDPGDAYRFQNIPLHLATSSFLTREHNIFCLKWMLKDETGIADSAALNSFFSTLANAEGKKQQLMELLSVLSDSTISSDSAGTNNAIANGFYKLSAASKSVIKDAVNDLQQIITNIPDTSLHADWQYLCKTIQNNLAQSPAKTLNELSKVRQQLLNKNGTRVFIIGSQSTIQKIMPAINETLSAFDNKLFIKQNYDTVKIIAQRVTTRMHTGEMPVFAGLVDPNMPTGVFINSAPLIRYSDTTKTDLLKLFAAELYSGGGKQSVYTKTIGAGLSYSTGVWANTSYGDFNYYAERTPELPQTLRFVINEIKRSPVDSTIVEYVISSAIGHTRAADEYESRGEAMAANLADNLTPDKVKNFRLAILHLRNEPGLISNIYKYKDTVYEKILPGYGIAGKDVPEASYFVIGSEKQMAAYEAYLQSEEGNTTRLYRLYPRDFWMIDEK